MTTRSREETLNKIPLEDRATDPGQLQKVESAMDRWQLVVADLQVAGLPDPCQGPFHHPADLALAAPMRVRGRAGTPDAPSSPSPFRCPVRPVPIQGFGSRRFAAARVGRGSGRELRAQTALATHSRSRPIRGQHPGGQSRSARRHRFHPPRRRGRNRIYAWAGSRRVGRVQVRIEPVSFGF